MSTDQNIWTRTYTMPWLRINLTPNVMLTSAISAALNGFGMCGGALILLAALGLVR